MDKSSLIKAEKNPHLKRNNLTINEIQVNMCSRVSGHSRVYSSWLMVAYYMVQASILGFSKRSNR